METNTAMESVAEITQVNEAGNYNSDCEAETVGGSLTKLFERKWDYFVIKKDEATGKLRSFVECCGRALAARE